MNLSTSMLASGSVHLGLFALLGGFTLGIKPLSQPVFIDYIEAQTAVTQVRQPELRKPQKVSLAQAVPAEVITTEDIVVPVAESPTPLAGASAAEVATAKEVYLSKLSRLLNAKKRYPEISLKMRQQGRLKVRFLLERDGSIASAVLVETSNFDPLNEAAKSLLAEIKKFDPIPSEVTDKQWAVTVPIEYLM